MDSLQNIYARRSIRKFKSQPVETEKLDELIRLAMAAPSAMNRCPWEFVIIDQPEGMDALREILRFGRYNAPAAVVICGNMRRGIPAVGREFWVQDCAAAMENLLLGATAMGLGTVWLGAYPLRGNVEKLSAELGLPGNIIPMGVAYVGYPDEEKEPRTQYKPEWIHWQRMGPKRPARLRLTNPAAADQSEYVLKALRTRRSIRKFTGEPLSEEQIRILLDVGFCAPTARNLRPWHFIVVQSGDKLASIVDIHPHAAMLPQSGCGIVVCGDHDRQPEEGYLALDCAAAIENMLLAAHGMGLGAVWLGIYPRIQRMEGLRTLLGIPKTVLPVGVIAVGHPAEEKAAPNRYEAGCVHREQW